MNRVILGMLIALTAPLATQPSIAATSEVVEPARLAAAAKLMAVSFPKARQDAMAASMAASFAKSSTMSVLELPEFKELLSKQPEAKAAFARFEKAVLEDCNRRVIASLPAMFGAMKKGYARRLTVPQMEELSRTLGTPAGQAYMEASAVMLDDPDMIAWQKASAAEAMADLPKHLQTFEAELTALKPPSKVSE